MMRRLQNLVFTVLVLVAAGLIAFLSTRFAWQDDFSYAQRASLNAQTLGLLRQLDAPVAITSYARPSGELRALIADFIARYRRAKPDIQLQFTDPDLDPGAARERGVTVDGELEIRYKGKSEYLKVLSERELTNALLRLSRQHERIVAFLSGDGERKPDGIANADLGHFGEMLAGQGVRMVALNLATQTRVPDNADLLVIADPRAHLPSAALAELADYVERGGNVLWLAEPNIDLGLEPLAKALGVRILAGIAVDAAGAQFGLGDPSFIAISSYPKHPLSKDFQLTTLFPQAAAVAALAEPRWEARPLLRSTDKSWTETGKIPKAGDAPGTIAYDADAGEIPGPLDLAMALTRLSPSPGKREQRAAVVGDADFLSNAYLGNGGNREFGQRLFNWLLADDLLIEIPDHGAPDRRLVLNQSQLGALSLFALVILPLALFACGVIIFWRRRRR